MAHSTPLHRAQKKLRTLMLLMLVAGNLIFLPGLLLAAESKEAFGLQSVINKAQDCQRSPSRNARPLCPSS